MIYVCLNGEILPEKHATLNTKNRAFRYGEGIVEEMRTSGIRVPFFDLHYDRLSRGLDALRMTYLSTFTSDSLLRSIELLIHRNRLFNINKVRLTVWRGDGDTLLSNAENVHYLIEVEPMEEKSFVLYEVGLKIDIFRDMCKDNSFLSPYNTTNALLPIMTGYFAHENSLGDCLIVNHDEKIVEASQSNIFLAQGKTIYTPNVESGATDGVIRKIIIDFAEKIGYNVAQSEALLPSLLYDTEEVFLVNDVSGIKWVAGYKQKRYIKKKSIEFTSILNRSFNA
jgi:branched-subunit amino acid aminotransferase/4-amino-4-deoxychorismate lyase